LGAETTIREKKRDCGNTKLLRIYEAIKGLINGEY
jgi:hypothetical protein